jgi:large subunit ribosomal protein L25
MHVMADYMAVAKTYQQAGKHHPVELTLSGKKHLAIIKDADFNPVKNQIRHVVFQAIKQDEKVETEVPIHFTGEAPAEKAGLLIIRQLDNVFLEALPKDLVDELKVDISGLVEIGDKVHVSDIVVPHGVTITTEPEHSIAVVEETKAQESEEAATAEDEAEAVAAATGGEAEGNQPSANKDD